MRSLRLLPPAALFISIGGSLYCLAVRHDYSMLIAMGGVIALLLFFSLLIGRMLKRGARSAPELWGRTLTLWWMLAGFLLATAAPRIFSFLLVGSLCAISLHEFLGFLPMEQRKLMRLQILMAYAALGLAVICAFRAELTAFMLVVPGAILAMAIVAVLQNRVENALTRLGFISLGLLFFVFDLGHGMWLLNLGAMALAYCLIMTELRDLISYWVGKAFARTGIAWLNRKIAPEVSPHKAWGAGLVALVLIAGLSALFTPLFPAYPRGPVSYLYSTGMGAVIGLLGLMGDLVFSLAKREFGIKDSGHGMPGGTGLIDRIDSLVLTFPAAYYLIYWKYFSTS